METVVPADNQPDVKSRPPGPDDILIQLDRIITSPEFPGAGRCAAFLSYVVTEVVAGRAKRIKGYTIAIEVFGREEGFTQDDPVVRIEAGRLRRALERYYLIAGQHDPIRIEVPKGCYVPTFTWISRHPDADTAILAPPMPKGFSLPRRHRGWLAGLTLTAVVGLVATGIWRVERPAATIPNGPKLVVAPFADLSGGADTKLYAAGLTEELLTALPRFKEIAVYGRETSESLSSEIDAEHVRSELGAQYLLAGGVRIDVDMVRVTARLLDTAKGNIIWSQTYNEDLHSRGLFAIQSDVANKVATAIAQPYGIIAQADAASLPPNDLDAYACTLRFYTYRAELSVEQHVHVRDCLERAVARYPSYATAWAMLSMIYLDENRFKFNQRPGASPALERSLQAARRAVQLDPDNTRGQQALMNALYFNRQIADSLRVGERALAINPNDTELMGEYGSRLAMSGEWKRGASVLQAALSLNPGGGGYYHGVLGIADYMQENYADAADEIRQADLQKFPLFHVVAAVIFVENGMPADAAREASKFTEMGSAFLINLTAELEQRIGRPEDRERFWRSMRKAGIQVPDTLAAN